MDRIEIGKLSAAYDVRRLGLADAPVVYAFCKADAQYYARCGAEVTLALVEHDLTALPPGVSPEQHYYLGFFTRGTLTAVMDLIAGYPGGSEAYFQRILDNAQRSIDPSNTVIGTYMCQGRMPQTVRERYVKMKGQPEHPANLDALIENFDRALSHPDGEDLRALQEAVLR